MKCRFCGTELRNVFIDLGASPPSNSFLTREQLNSPEIYYPLRVYVCHSCFLVQIDEYKKSSEIFCDDYVYFSSMSRSWLEHSKRYVGMIKQRLGLDNKSFVIEIASNDGYLLQYVKQDDIPCLGIEPTACTAAEARKKGVEVLEDFFGEKLAGKLKEKNKTADLILGNNVLAHVPDIVDFVKGLKIALKPHGTITMEFPHLLQLVANNQFDTIYHEHFSYLSFSIVHKIFGSLGLVLYDVEELPTHGGSLRIYARHAEHSDIQIKDSVARLLDVESRAGMNDLGYYLGFQERAFRAKLEFTSFLLSEKEKGAKIAAYGAAAKGNTLLNYCGIKSDLIEFVVDMAPSKQGRFLPGSRIPVVAEQKIRETKPDYVIILPWNIRDEIKEQLDYIKEWAGKFVIVIPGISIE